MTTRRIHNVLVQFIEAELQRLGVNPLSYAYLECLDNALVFKLGGRTNAELLEYIQSMVSELTVDEYDQDTGDV